MLKGSDAMIELKNITKIYNTNGNTGIGLNNVSVTFNKGEFVGVIGPSGSGKTTLLNVVTGMDSYEEGELILFGKDTTGYTQEDFEIYRRNNVSFIFQDYQLIDSFTALDNVVMELLFKGIEKDEAIKQATELLKKVGLAHRLKNKSSQLSGGEKQRVVIARALASNCQILACDEPTGNLDSSNSLEIINLLKEISKEKLVLFVTHDPELLENVATRVLTIKDGNISNDETTIKTEEYEMNVEQQKKIKLSTNLYIAFKNIISTPKKTIMLLLIFFITSLYLIANLTQIELNISDSLKMTDIYHNTTSNRVVVYDDVDYNDGVKISNDSFLDDSVYVEISNTLPATIAFEYYYSVLFDDVTKGRNPENENEVVISINSLFYELVDTYLANIENGLVKATINDKEYTVVGVVEDDALLTAKIFFYNNKFPEANKTSIDDVLLEVNNYRHTYFSEESETNYLINIPNNINLNDINLTLGNYKINITEDMVQRNDDNYYEINYNYIELNYSDIIYRTSFIFSNDIDAKKAFDYFDNKGYTVIYPDNFEYDKTIMYYVEFAISAISIFSISITMFFVILIVTVISGLVFKTTHKDFNIMRIIGLAKKDVFIVIAIQVYVLLFTSFITTILIATMLSFTPINNLISIDYILKNFFLLKNISTITLLLILLGFFITRSQHKKIFKVSATTSLRGAKV